MTARDRTGLQGPRGRRGVLAVGTRIFSGLSAVLVVSAAVLFSGAGASDMRPVRLEGATLREFERFISESLDVVEFDPKRAKAQPLRWSVAAAFEFPNRSAEIDRFEICTAPAALAVFRSTSGTYLITADLTLERVHDRPYRPLGSVQYQLPDEQKRVVCTPDGGIIIDDDRPGREVFDQGDRHTTLVRRDRGGNWSTVADVRTKATNGRLPPSADGIVPVVPLPGSGEALPDWMVPFDAAALGVGAHDAIIVRGRRTTVLNGFRPERLVETDPKLSRATPLPVTPSMLEAWSCGATATFVTGIDEGGSITLGRLHIVDRKDPIADLFERTGISSARMGMGAGGRWGWAVAGFGDACILADLRWRQDRSLFLAERLTIPFADGKSMVISVKRRRTADAPRGLWRLDLIDGLLLMDRRTNMIVGRFERKAGKTTVFVVRGMRSEGRREE